MLNLQVNHDFYKILYKEVKKEVVKRNKNMCKYVFIENVINLLFLNNDYYIHDLSAKKLPHEFYKYKMRRRFKRSLASIKFVDQTPFPRRNINKKRIYKLTDEWQSVKLEIAKKAREEYMNFLPQKFKKLKLFSHPNLKDDIDLNVDIISQLLDECKNDVVYSQLNDLLMTMYLLKNGISQKYKMSNIGEINATGVYNIHQLPHYLLRLIFSDQNHYEFPQLPFRIISSYEKFDSIESYLENPKSLILKISDDIKCDEDTVEYAVNNLYNSKHKSNYKSNFKILFPYPKDHERFLSHPNVIEIQNDVVKIVDQFTKYAVELGYKGNRNDLSSLFILKKQADIIFYLLEMFEIIPLFDKIITPEKINTQAIQDAIKREVNVDVLMVENNVSKLEILQKIS